MTLSKTDMEVLGRFDTRLIKSVEEESYTLLHCKYYAPDKYPFGGWVMIHKTTYLVETNNVGESIEMLHAINIPYAPQKHFFKMHGEVLNFVLVFPKIPKHWTAFDLNEEASLGNGFKIQEIRRNLSGIYRVQIH